MSNLDSYNAVNFVQFEQLKRMTNSDNRSVAEIERARRRNNFLVMLCLFLIGGGLGLYVLNDEADKLIISAAKNNPNPEMKPMELIFRWTPHDYDPSEVPAVIPDEWRVRMPVAFIRNLIGKNGDVGPNEYAMPTGIWHIFDKLKGGYFSTAIEGVIPADYSSFIPLEPERKRVE